MFLSVPCTCPRDKSYLCAECLRKQQGPTKYLTYLDHVPAPERPERPEKPTKRDAATRPCYACSKQDRFASRGQTCRCPVFSRVISPTPPWICRTCNKYVESDPSLAAPDSSPSSPSSSRKGPRPPPPPRSSHVCFKDRPRLLRESSASVAGHSTDEILSPPSAFRSSTRTSRGTSSFSTGPQRVSTGTGGTSFLSSRSLSPSSHRWDFSSPPSPPTTHTSFRTASTRSTQQDFAGQSVHWSSSRGAQASTLRSSSGRSTTPQGGDVWREGYSRSDLFSSSPSRLTSRSPDGAAGRSTTGSRATSVCSAGTGRERGRSSSVESRGSQKSYCWVSEVSETALPISMTETVTTLPGLVECIPQSASYTSHSSQKMRASPTSSILRKRDFSCQHKSSSPSPRTNSPIAHGDYAQCYASENMGSLLEGSASSSRRSPYPGTEYARSTTSFPRTGISRSATRKADFACQPPTGIPQGSHYGRSHRSPTHHATSPDSGAPPRQLPCGYRSTDASVGRTSSPTFGITDAPKTPPMKRDYACQSLYHPTQSWRRDDSPEPRPASRRGITSDSKTASARSDGTCQSESSTSQGSRHGGRRSVQTGACLDATRAETTRRPDCPSQSVTRMTQGSQYESAVGKTPTHLISEGTHKSSRKVDFACQSAPRDFREAETALLARHDEPKIGLQNHSKLSPGRSSCACQSAPRSLQSNQRRRDEETDAQARGLVTGPAATSPPWKADFASQSSSRTSQGSRRGGTQWTAPRSPSPIRGNVTASMPKADFACQSLSQTSQSSRTSRGEGIRHGSTHNTTNTPSTMARGTDFACQSTSRTSHSSHVSAAQPTLPIPILCVTDASLSPPGRSDCTSQDVFRVSQGAQCHIPDRPYRESTFLIRSEKESPGMSGSVCSSLPPVPHSGQSTDWFKAEKVSGSATKSRLLSKSLSPPCGRQPQLTTPSCRRGSFVESDLSGKSQSAFSRRMQYDRSLKEKRRGRSITSGPTTRSSSRLNMASQGFSPSPPPHSSQVTSFRSLLKSPLSALPVHKGTTGTDNVTKRIHSHFSEESRTTAGGKSTKVTTSTITDHVFTPGLPTIKSVSRSTQRSSQADEESGRKVLTSSTTDRTVSQTLLTSRSPPPSAGDSHPSEGHPSAKFPVITVTDHTRKRPPHTHQGICKRPSHASCHSGARRIMKMSSSTISKPARFPIWERRQPARRSSQNTRRTSRQRLTRGSISTTTESWKAPTKLIGSQSRFQAYKSSQHKSLQQSMEKSAIYAPDAAGFKATTSEVAVQSRTRVSTGTQCLVPRRLRSGRPLSFSDHIIKITPCHSDYAWQGCSRATLSSLLRAAGGPSRRPTLSRERSVTVVHCRYSETLQSQSGSSTDSLGRPPWDDSFFNYLDREDSYTNLLDDIKRKCGPPCPFYDDRVRRGARPPWQDILTPKRSLCKSTWNAHTLSSNALERPPWNPFYKK